ncbi:hypothetical protein E2C01_071504 [Portunus trituberculatus]|uniref:Uncharacterized protein n=1 Tax=Portunus trituberculatus TaxID=210409 RepID=A0A5B7I044_PORTR|nr:hypothetical protein [Portunus trituberculatus]
MTMTLTRTMRQLGRVVGVAAPYVSMHQCL